MNQPLRGLWPRGRFTGVAVALFVAFALSACGSEQSGGADQASPPPTVTVETVSPRTVLVEGEYAGRVRGSREVEVRARVEGILEERLYTEGQIVAEGEALFRIDPEPYEIAVRSAEAERANAAANLDQAKRDWERISGLYERDAVSRRERDQALTNRQLAEARMALTDAAVADARRNLRYTEVQAPVSGVTGLEVLPEGSLIERGTLLTTLTQHDPVHVRFALPENDAAVQRVARHAMVRGNDAGHRYAARIRLPDGRRYPGQGEIDFTASTIDPRTGTVTARAVFPNPDGALVPGQFVRVTVGLQELEAVFLIDQRAVGEGPDGPQVFVVDDADTARVRALALGPVVDGRQVVLDGLESGDRVVVNGQVSLSDGAEVRSVQPAHGED
ncbi:MAG: efflux RND transporter periplasmic adaptor subunit [Ectothiorhodospiraceae bacterium]|nr:efflux RND transporter periplasmic adaptor subunit [Ectothiorhodospiraceae bacterium]